MRIDSSGNVGIGTTSPGAKLHINGSVRGDQYGALKIDTGNGYLIAGPTNTQAMHFSTDRPYFHFNTGIRVSSGNIGSSLGTLTLNTGDTPQITVKSTGNVGIGTTYPSTKLHVHGAVYVKDSINCYKLTTRYIDGADFVFEEDYDLPDLNEVKTFIQKNKHLPEIPPADEMQANGVSVSDMLTKHLQKIEELTLYMIDLKSGNTKLQSENEDLRALVQRLEERLSKLETRTRDINKMSN